MHVGVDVGGTFTDYFAATPDSGKYWKELGREPRHLQIIESVESAMRGRQLASFVHGSTLAVNALLELSHRRPALVTTQGFEDVLELRRQRRLDLYRPNRHHPMPLVPSELRFGVRERIGPDGGVITPLSTDEADRVIARIPEDVETVAICLLHAYANPAHELHLEQRIRVLRPKLLAVLSSRAFPLIREYERSASVVAEAYLLPIVSEYLARLELAFLRLAPGARLWVMESTGSRTELAEGRDRPTRTIMSGPAAGVRAAEIIGRLSGHTDLITFDVGGTSADVGLVNAGIPAMVYERTVAGIPVLGSGIDVHSIGAGGGSILSVDEGGLLHVGPRSAGSNPGPASYGLGGCDPTISDAHVVLNRLPESSRLGGGLTVQRELAVRSLRQIAKRLGWTVETAAEAAIKIVTSNMVNAIRLVTVERGYDPRQYVLVAFGGAGPLHAWEVASRLGIATVLIPGNPGVLSAFGSATAPLRADWSVSLMAQEHEVERVRAAVDSIQQRLWTSMRAQNAERVRITITIDMKYEGQNWEIPVGVDAITASSLRDAFDARYLAQYGMRLNRRLEYVAAHVSMEAENPIAVTSASMLRPRTMRRRHQSLLFTDGGWKECDVWEGGVPARGIAGLAVVCLADATIYVPAGCVLRPCRSGYILASGSRVR